MRAINRKEQIEKDFLRLLVRELKAAGCPVSAKGRALIKARLRSAAMVGACEERARTLAILRAQPGKTKTIVSQITKRGVLSVLGYDD